MKRSLSIIIFAMFSFSAFTQGIDFVHVKWQEAVDMAKEQNKLLFVDSYAEWCGPCKKMAKNEFVKSEVGSIYNENFVNLKLDMESKNGRTFDSKYPVSAYPTMFFLDGEGNVVKKVKGGKKGAQLIAMAKAVIKSHDTSGKFKEKYDEGDRSYEVVYSYIEALNKASKPSLKISNDYLKSNPEITEEQKLKFYHVATVDADSKIFDKMVANKLALIELVGAESFDKKVTSACQNTVMKAIEYETESLLEEAVEKSKSLNSGSKEFGMKAQMVFARNMKSIDMYTKAAKGLTKIYLKNDTEKLNGIILEMHNVFAGNSDVIDLSSDIAKKYFKKSKSVKSTLAYAKSLMLQGDLEKSKSIIEKGVKHATKSGENAKSLEMMIKVLDKRIKDA